jgi:hypothetical protein
MAASRLRVHLSGGITRDGYAGAPDHSEALQQPTHQNQQGRENADGGVSGRACDGKYPDRHEAQAQYQPGAATILVGIGPKDDGPDPAHQKPAPKVIKDRVSDTKGLPLGKNVFPMASA